MPKPIDHIAYLSQNIGPRPAGTEEEQKAAQYIAEQLQQEAGLSAAIEDFRGETNGELPTMICALLSFLLALISFFLPIIRILAFAITLVTALLYLAESLGHPLLSRYFHQGVSQNVVAKFEPEQSSSGGSVRRRKIIVVANYDSDRVRSELSELGLKILPILKKVILGAILAIPLLLLLRILFFADASGKASLFLHILLGIAMFFTSLPVVLFVLHKMAPYNEAANCNASGVAAMLELARKIGRRGAGGASLTQENPQIGATIHGEERARALGLLDDETELVYEVPEFCPPTSAPLSQSERLASAKMSIAAITGQEFRPRSHESVAQNLVQVKASGKEEAREEAVSEFRGEIREALTHAPGAERLEPGVTDEDEAELGEVFAQPGQYVQEASPYNAAPSHHTADQGLATSFQEEAPAAAVSSDSGRISADSGRSSVLYGAPQKSEVPEWFKKAQEKAKKSAETEAKVQRSQYADAFDSALEANATEAGLDSRAHIEKREARIRGLREDIMEASVPKRSDRDELGAQDVANVVDVEIAGGEKVQESLGEKGLSSEYDDLGGTRAMPPIDVSNLRKGDSQRNSAKNDTQSLTSVQTSEKKTSPEIINIPQIPTEANAATSSPSFSRKPILLPDIGTTGSHVPLTSAKQQRAPLAMDGPESAQDAAKSLLTLLPTIGGDDASDTAHLTSNENERATDAEENRLDGLKGSNTNSFSVLSPAGIDQNNNSETSAHSIVTTAGAFGASGMTGTFKPIADELLKDADPDDIYVEDADDSVFDRNLTETGAFAGPGYVEMPKSRIHRLFGRFGSKKAKEEVPSAQQWLDVDEDFDAREAGAARGGWDSFQEDGDGFEGGHGSSGAEDSWEGGAFSRSSRVEPEGLDEAATDTWESLEEDTSLYSSYGEAEGYASEIEEIQNFYGQGFNTETWFVALGSQLANNGGIKAFLKEHEQELRGAIIISLEALGDGDLCYLGKEGLRSKQGTSTRMKRYIKKASRETNTPIEERDILWRESVASVVGRRGLQTVSIAGMSGAKPAHFCSENDVMDNIDEARLMRNTEFAMELIRSI